MWVPLHTQVKSRAAGCPAVTCLGSPSDRQQDMGPALVLLVEVYQLVQMERRDTERKCLEALGCSLSPGLRTVA